MRFRKNATEYCRNPDGRPRAPTSYATARWGSRARLKPPLVLGWFLSSVVVGVSNDVETLAYDVRTSANVQLAPMLPLGACIVRPPLLSVPSLRWSSFTLKRDQS